MRYVVNVSGGLASYEALRRTIERYGREQTSAVFADTLIEDADLYRFLADTEQHLGIELVRLADGRTPWQVMRDERVITMQQMAPCSRLLKRAVIDRWVAETFSGQEVTRVFGYDWTEPQRAERLAAQLAPAPIWCPLLEAPYVTKDDIGAAVRAVGIEPPRLYALGFPHNNCGGGCVRAGQGHFAHLLRVLPHVYDEWERNEQAMRDYLGKDVAILRDRTGAESRPLTLAALRERVEAREPYESDIWAGCGCFAE